MKTRLCLFEEWLRRLPQHRRVNFLIKQLRARSIIPWGDGAEGLNQSGRRRMTTSCSPAINPHVWTAHADVTEWKVSSDPPGRFVSPRYQPEPLLPLSVSSRVIPFPPATVGSDWRTTRFLLKGCSVQAGVHLIDRTFVALSCRQFEAIPARFGSG